MTRAIKKPIIAAASLSLAACMTSRQSAVNPAGFEAQQTAHLWWWLLGLLGAIFVVVMALALWPLVRRYRPREHPLTAPHERAPQTERTLARVVGAGSIATLVILFALVAISVSVGKVVSGPPPGQDPLTVEVIGNQWWWYVRYVNSDASRIVVTANELHIPVGRPVQMRGTSNDVIHSFWIPNLTGKRDLIPSRVTTEWIKADHPGEFRGQCAEFCGLQHAHMALWTVAEPPDQFNAWMERQLTPAAAPSDPIAQQGQQVFLSHACVFCHAVAGTPAAGSAGPDLTHFGSRRTIAAGTLANTKENLANWIGDPQGVKPGNHMASLPLNQDDIESLVEYLEGLK